MKSEDDSEDVSVDIDAEFEATTKRVTQTPASKKHLLDIITKITTEEAAVVKSTSVETLQPPAKSPSITTKITSKRRGATSGGVAAPEK